MTSTALLVVLGALALSLIRLLQHLTRKDK